MCKEDYTPGRCSRYNGKVEKKAGIYNKYCSPECRAIPNKVCKVCKKGFKPYRKGVKYCSRQCLHISLKRKKEYRCKQCQKWFLPKANNRTTFCSRECSFANQKTNRKLRRRARKCRRIYLNNCRICGKVFAALRKRNNCSEKCRKEYNNRKTYNFAKERHGNRKIKCKECLNWFVKEYGIKKRVFCSSKCSMKYSGRNEKAKRRCRLKESEYESINPIEIFERDGWRCQICKRKTLKNKRGTAHLKAPELDHIIPVANGGPHTHINVQCACRACNLWKSNTHEGQARLFG